MTEQEYYLKPLLDRLLPEILTPYINDIRTLQQKVAELEIKVNMLETKGYIPYIVSPNSYNMGENI